MKTQLILFVLLLITVSAEQHGQTSTTQENNNSLLFFIFLASILALLISFYLNRNFENSFINILPSPIKKILVGFSSIQPKNLFSLFKTFTFS